MAHRILESITISCHQV